MTTNDKTAPSSQQPDQTHIAGSDEPMKMHGMAEPVMRFWQEPLPRT